MLFLLIMQVIFLLQYNAILFCRESLKEQVTFHNLSYILKHKHDIYHLFQYTKHLEQS